MEGGADAGAAEAAGSGVAVMLTGSGMRTPMFANASRQKRCGVLI